MTQTSNARSTGGSAAIHKALAVGSALTVAAGGLLHLRTWDSDYREIPDGVVPGLWVVKVGFPINAAASILVAAALLVLAFGLLPRLRLPVALAALALQLGSIGALVASRGPGIFGWSEKGYSGDAGQILTVEVVAAVVSLALALFHVVQLRRALELTATPLGDR